MSINAEILMELLEDQDVLISKDVAEIVADEIAGHLSEINTSHYLNDKAPSKKEENLQRLINNLKYENEVYRNSVKNRRGASHVYIEDGEVKYDL